LVQESGLFSPRNLITTFIMRLFCILTKTPYTRDMKYLWIVPVVVFGFIFQNCGDDPTAETSPSQEDGLVTVSETSIADLNIPQRLTLSPQSNPIVIDLDSGEVDPETSNRSTPARCLAENKLNAVRAILSGAEICEIINEVPAGTNCTFAFIPPYVSIFDGDLIELGAYSNGCREKTTDLCENSADLRAWVTDIDPNIDFTPCSN